VVVKDRLRSAAQTGAVEAMWAELTVAGTPLVEPLDDHTSLVTFLWRGEADTTRIEWGVQLPLDRLPGTDLWHLSIVLPSDLRTVYYFAHDGATDVPFGTSASEHTHIDPLNRRPLLFPGDPHDPTDRVSWASLLELPGARGAGTRYGFPRAANHPRPCHRCRPAPVPSSQRGWADARHARRGHPAL
jgi:hypothetical protein